MWRVPAFCPSTSGCGSPVPLTHTSHHAWMDPVSRPRFVLEAGGGRGAEQMWKQCSQRGEAATEAAISDSVERGPRQRGGLLTVALTSVSHCTERRRDLERSLNFGARLLCLRVFIVTSRLCATGVCVRSDMLSSVLVWLHLCDILIMWQPQCLWGPDISLDLELLASYTVFSWY